MNTAGRGRVRAISDHRVEWLADGWEVGASAPGEMRTPHDAAAAGLAWMPAQVPSTVASTMAAAGLWTLDAAPKRFDADDWWYRTTFAVPQPSSGECWLCFDGIATLAEVWLNGTPLFACDGMFTAHERRVDPLLTASNELVVCCRSLDSALTRRRPRPRWRTPMVEHQQLRWHRTTLLGRTPGWSPPAAAVGLWRGVRLEWRRDVMVREVQLVADAGGRLAMSCHAAALGDRQLHGIELQLQRDGRSWRVAVPRSDDAGRHAAELVVPGVECWWPHTHGSSALYEARLLVSHSAGTTEVDLGAIGFRTVTRMGTRDEFSIGVNDVPIFARGACWTPLDPVSLVSTPDATGRAIAQIADGGMNMVRVGGTMVYEDDHFLDACDRHGVMVWHDFMFANMDYPDADDGFVSAAGEEVRQQLLRLQGRPSLSVLCGNSEVEQQAAMWGASRERWASPLFHGQMATQCATWCPDVPYTPSSATGGAFPHQANAGPTSYYGVGAYLRPVDDARRAEVRFASECLAFANVPSAASLARSPLLRSARVHHPAWKGRTPRDLGAGWDFDDVRDHYVQRLFNVDPLAVRYADHERYLELGRVATGEVMAAVFAEWRRRRSVTRGGLIWFLRDLWDGAGWGVIDASGAPKPAWYPLRRALAPVAVAVSDEGVNGLALHVVNDRPDALQGTLEVALYQGGAIRVGGGVTSISVGAHDALELNAVSLLDGFADASYAYRFGPPSHDLVVATLRDTAGAVRGQALHLPGGWPSAQGTDVGLRAELQRRDDATYALRVRTERLALAIRVTIPGYASEDDYFHLAPGAERELRLHATASGGPALVGPSGTLQPLNAVASTPVAASA